MRQFIKNTNGYIDPNEIIAIVVVMIILAAGTFAFFTTWDTLSEDEALKTTVSDSTYQGVTDPTVTQNVTLPTGAVISSITETLNDGTTQTVPPANYSHVGNKVTITVTG